MVWSHLQAATKREHYTQNEEKSARKTALPAIPYCTYMCTRTLHVRLIRALFAINSVLPHTYVGTCWYTVHL